MGKYQKEVPTLWVLENFSFHFGRHFLLNKFILGIRPHEIRQWRRVSGMKNKGKGMFGVEHRIHLLTTHHLYFCVAEIGIVNVECDLYAQVF